MTKSKLIKLDANKLPEGWCVSKLDSIALYIQRGKSPKYIDKSDLPVINQKCVRWEGVDRTYLKYIHPEQFDKWTPERFLVDGDILWNSTGTGTIGRAALAHVVDGERLVADSHITIVRPASGIVPKYLHYWIMGHEVQNSIGAVQSGSTNQVELSKGAVQATPIPLAPTSTQMAIVSKIEELFSHIDAGVEGLKQAKAKLQQYRQSVLKDAVTGKLTEQWRAQNVDMLEPAEHLLERILDERRANWEAEQLKAFEEKGKTPKNDKWKDKYKVVDPLTERDVAGLPLLPEGWCYAKLGQVIDDPKYGTSKKCTYDSKGKGVLRIPNIAAGEINPEDMKYAEFTDDEIATYKLNEGDILTIRSNGSVSLVGKCAVISDKDTDFLFAGYLIRLRPVLKHIDANYLKGVLTSGFLRKQIEMLAKSSSGVNNINTGELQSLIIPVCSLQEQRLIAQDIDSKNTAINRQFEEYDRLFKQASKNKSAILKKAFSGELVENIETSESAEQLLGRIHEEKKLLEQKSRFAKKKPTARAKKMEKRPIIDVLKESNKALSVDELFELAGFQKEVTPESIEEFYQEIKTVAEAKFVEVSPILFGGKKQGDKFEYKEVRENEA
ncbi:restriction endonuclease subunit S [Vibrio cincinnatiensis]|uniref:restriction endonuclease subunit S n=1 Tax=Vibrio cincinnatiensis TaxID=675 RepID=UPI0038AEA74A